MKDLIILYAPFVIWGAFGIVAFIGWCLLGDGDDE